ncbi:MAG: Na/Pi cotransporter family protein [Kiritimatiellia bacterium]
MTSDLQSSPSLFFDVFALLGGLGLFLFGMQTLSAGLNGMAGKGMRRLIQRSTRNRVVGITLGSGLGFLVQSSAATVMIVGFVNAGLINLPQAVPVILGANVGTSLSMQLITFKISEYSLMAVSLGVLGQMVLPGPRAKAGGGTLLGFGLLFLGLSTMSGAIAPYRDTLAPYLAMVDGTRWQGALLGVLTAAGITAVIQSSGATIGMCFALIHAGAITQLPGAFPIVIGAGIGTCVTALLGSIGANIQARRAAVSHLLFNITSVAISLLLAPLIYEWVPRLPGDLVHQAANANVIRMLVSATLLLPFTGLLATMVSWMIPAKGELPVPSFLDESLINRPEQALQACIQELQRTAILCERSMVLHAKLLKSLNRKWILGIVNNEAAVNEIKRSMQQYVGLIAGQKLSKRQRLMLQHLNRCMSYLERMGDHIDRFREITVSRLRKKQILFDEETLAQWFQLYGAALKVLRLTIRSLDPAQKRFQATAKEILDARDAYVKLSLEFRSDFNDRLSHAPGKLSPMVGVLLAEYTDGLDRIVRHAKSIALVEGRAEFWIKRKKLNRVSRPAENFEEPDWVDVTDYLDQLLSEDPL